jgi:hypothetical protein
LKVQRNLIDKTVKIYFSKIHIRLAQLYVGMTILDGYKSFFDAADDPNLQASKKKDGMFFIFRSIEAWKEEKCTEEYIPQKNLFLMSSRKTDFWPTHEDMNGQSKNCYPWS